MENVLNLLEAVVRGDSHAVRSAAKDAAVAAIKDLVQSAAPAPQDEYAPTRADFEHACATIARMHFAAVGMSGPRRGVVEDIEDLRSDHEAAKVENESLRTQLEAAQQDVDRLRAEMNSNKETENGKTDSNGQAPVADSDRHQTEGEAGDGA